MNQARNARELIRSRMGEVKPGKTFRTRDIIGGSGDHGGNFYETLVNEFRKIVNRMESDGDLIINRIKPKFNTYTKSGKVIGATDLGNSVISLVNSLREQVEKRDAKIAELEDEMSVLSDLNDELTEDLTKLRGDRVVMERRVRSLEENRIAHHELSISDRELTLQ